MRDASAVACAESPDRARTGGPGLLAHVLVLKYTDHLPLCRQSRIFVRDSIDLDRSTLADWVGGASKLLQPLVDAVSRYVFEDHKLHADDTPVPVLCPGRGTTKHGRLWTYVRDDRPAGSLEPTAVLFRYSPDRKGQWPRYHLREFTGILQADGYAGFDRFYGERIQEAAAGRTCDGSLMTFTPPRARRLPPKHWSASPPSKPSTLTSAVDHRANAVRFVRLVLARAAFIARSAARDAFGRIEEERAGARHSLRTH